MDRLVRIHVGLFVVALALMGMVNTAGALPGTAEVPVVQWVPIYLPMMLLLFGFGLWIWWRQEGSLASMRASMAHQAWVCVAGATGLFLYALLSAALATQEIWVTRFRVPTPVPKQLVILPPMQALVTTWTAFVVVAIVPAEKRFVWLWRLSVLLVPLSLLGWARVWIDDRSIRLWTQMGGAAVYPVVLMVGLGVAVAGVLRPYRRRQSQILALSHVALLLLTGSRGAVVMVVAFAALALVRLRRRHTGLGARLASPKRIAVVGGVAVVLAALSSRVLGRIDLTGLDHGVGRVATWMIGLRAAGQNVQTLLLGAGSGSIWPWFAYESGWQPIPWRSRVANASGLGLYHSHSVYIEVLGELGLIGLVLLALVVVPLLVQWVRGGQVAAMVLSSAVCACLVGFLVDSYLFKNFPVSLIWWVVAFGCLSAGLGADESTVEAPSAGESSSGTAVEPPPDEIAESARDVGGVADRVTR